MRRYCAFSYEYDRAAKQTKSGTADPTVHSHELDDELCGPRERSSCWLRSST